MEKQSRIESILRKMREDIDEETTVTDPIEYENKLLEMGQQFSLEILKSSVEKLPKSRNQKKKS